MRLLLAPYELWKEQKERSDRLLATDAGRLVAECIVNGEVDYGKLREPMAALIDPNRDYYDEWERLRLEDEVKRARQVATAEEEARASVRRREAFRRRPERPSPVPRPKPKVDLPFHAVFRHVAFHSAWAAEYDRLSDPDRECRKSGEYALSKQVREALARGDVKARGRKFIPGTNWEFTLASMPIPQEFWTNSYFQAFGEIQMADNARCIATSGERPSNERYSEITLDRGEVLARWKPQRSPYSIGPDAPTQIAKDYGEAISIGERKRRER